MVAGNYWSDILSLAPLVQEDAYFIVRELALMPKLVTVFSDQRGGNLRRGYKYSSITAGTIAESDDLTSSSFAPSADQTLTPIEIGAQAFVSQLRIDSVGPENIVTDVARELGLAATAKIESLLVTDMASLTAGTIGTAGSTITWGYLAAAIAQARAANKSMAIPLACVMHGYQWAVLAKSASIAGAAIAAVAPGFQEELTRSGKVAEFMGVPVYQVFSGTITSDDFVGGVFPRESLALDWRRPIGVRAQVDESRRGTEFNLSAVFAHGVWRPELGMAFIFDASAPTS